MRVGKIERITKRVTWGNYDHRVVNTKIYLCFCFSKKLLLEYESYNQPYTIFGIDSAKRGYCSAMEVATNGPTITKYKRVIRILQDNR